MGCGDLVGSGEAMGAAAPTCGDAVTAGLVDSSGFGDLMCSDLMDSGDGTVSGGPLGFDDVMCCGDLMDSGDSIGCGGLMVSNDHLGSEADLKRRPLGRR